METAGTPAPAERGWRRPILALALLLLVPAIPQLRAILPVEATFFLLAPALAACALVAWWLGGSFTVAVTLALLAAWQSTWPLPGSSASFRDLTRGWGLLAGAMFGIVSMIAAGRPFFGRALSAIALALAAVLGSAAVGIVDLPEVRAALATEFARRNAATVESLARGLELFAGMFESQASQIRERSGPFVNEYAIAAGRASDAAVTLAPALLALETLAALALGWAVYHRLGRTRIGPPLARLRDFRFNDQLVWGLIAGLVFMLVPTLRDFRAVGASLVLFYGVLYALRGLGVVTWYTGRAGGLLILALFLLSPLAPAIFATMGLGLAALTLGVGLGDTWINWRERPRPNT